MMPIERGGPLERSPATRILETGTDEHTEQAFASSLESLGLDANRRQFEPKLSISEMPNEILAKITGHVPLWDLRNVALTNWQLRNVVTGHFGKVYGRALGAEQVARREWENGKADSKEGFFRKAMSAQEAVQQLKLVGVLDDPKDPVFHLALLNVGLHARYFPHPWKKIPTLFFEANAKPPLTSSDIDQIIQGVLDRRDDPAEVVRNLHALHMRKLLGGDRAEISVLFQKGQLSRHPWYLLHKIAENDGCGSLDLLRLQKRWVKHVLSIDDERTRSYAIRVAVPRFLEEDIHAALQENAEAMTDPELSRVTLWHLGLDI